MLVAKIVYEVTIRSDAYLLQDLLHRQKRRAQHLLRLSQAKFLKILSRARTRFLFKEMTKARWRQNNQARQRRSVPRG